MLSNNGNGIQINQLKNLADLENVFKKNRPNRVPKLVSKPSEEKVGVFEIANSSGYGLVQTYETIFCDYYEYRLIYYSLLFLNYQAPQIERNTQIIKILLKLIANESIETFQIPFGLELSKSPTKADILILIKQFSDVVETYIGKHSIIYASNCNSDYDVSFILVLHYFVNKYGSFQALLNILGCKQCSIQKSQIVINDFIMKINRRANMIQFKILENSNIKANENLDNSNDFQLLQSTIREIQSFEEDEKTQKKDSLPQKFLHGLLDQIPQCVSKSMIFKGQENAQNNMNMDYNTQTKRNLTNNKQKNLEEESGEQLEYSNQQKFPTHFQYKKNNNQQILTKSRILQQKFNEQKSKLKFDRVINQIYLPLNLDYRITEQNQPISSSIDKNKNVLSHRKMKTASTQIKNSSNLLQQNEIFTPRELKNHLIQINNQSQRLFDSYTPKDLKTIKNQLVSEKQANDFRENRRKLLQQYLKRQKQQNDGLKRIK